MQHPDSNPVGRPRKEVWAREQTRVWATAVSVSLKVAGLPLSTLGDDARSDLWSRYRQGLTTPIQERVARIEKVVPGTARYFYATAWELASNKEYCPQQLKESLIFMSASVREHFQPIIQLPAAAQGKFWRRHWDHQPSGNKDYEVPHWEDDDDERYEFVRHIDHPVLGIDMLGAYLFLLREAEVQQNARAYLNRLSWLPEVRLRSNNHPLLSSIGSAFWLHLIEPVATMNFADPEAQTHWQMRLAQFPNRKPLLQAFYAVWTGNSHSDEKFAAEVGLYINFLHGSAE